jgi:hypothetical protein
MTDDELFEAVRARVRAGHPTDEPSEVTVPEPASLSAVEEVERVVGYPMPPLVRRLYLEIADGGIGPFSGFYPLLDGPESGAMLCRVPHLRIGPNGPTTHTRWGVVLLFRT